MSSECNVCHLPVKTVNKAKHSRQHEESRSRNDIESITAPRSIKKRKSSTSSSQTSNTSQTLNASQTKRRFQTTKNASNFNSFDFYNTYDTYDTYDNYDDYEPDSLDQETIISPFQDPEDINVFFVPDSNTSYDSIDSKNKDVYKIFEHFNVSQAAINELVKWYNKQKSSGMHKKRFYIKINCTICQIKHL